MKALIILLKILTNRYDPILDRFGDNFNVPRKTWESNVKYRARILACIELRHYKPFREAFDLDDWRIPPGV